MKITNVVWLLSNPMNQLCFLIQRFRVLYKTISFQLLPMSVTIINQKNVSLFLLKIIQTIYVHLKLSKVKGNYSVLFQMYQHTQFAFFNFVLYFRHFSVFAPEKERVFQSSVPIFSLLFSIFL